MSFIFSLSLWHLGAGLHGWETLAYDVSALQKIRKTSHNVNFFEKAQFLRFF